MLALLLALIGLTLAPPAVPRVPGRHPHVFHLMPYLAGDSLGAIRKAVLRGFGWIDQNANIDANGVVWIVHWGIARKNHLLWYWTGAYDARGREIRVRDKHAGTPFHKRSTDEMSRLRTRKRGGKRLHTAAEHFAKIAATRRLKLALELKGGPWSIAALTRLHEEAAAAGCRVIVMTLDTIPGWITRLSHAKAAGWQTVLLRHRRENHVTRKNHPAYIDAVWG